MSLEATMILLDNSSASINGDYYPTRWEAQKDFCQLISSLKYNGHPESVVGVGLQTGSQLILSAPTGEQTKIMAALHHVRQQGLANITTSLSICQLALKHRLNKAQRQRVVMVVASLITENEKNLVDLAKKLKKNEIAVDIVNIGPEENLPKIEAFIAAINKDDNSHYVYLPPGPNPIGEQLVGSPIMGGQQNFNEFMDPNMDPEIAEAIRMSLQEEKERQERDKQKLQDSNKQPQKMEVIFLLKIEEDNLDEEELLNRAKQLSMQDQENIKEAFQDEKFVNELLSQIPGVDQNSEEVKKAIEDLNKKKDPPK